MLQVSTFEVNSSQKTGKRPVNSSQKNSHDELSASRSVHPPASGTSSIHPAHAAVRIDCRPGRKTDNGWHWRRVREEDPTTHDGSGKWKSTWTVMGARSKTQYQDHEFESSTNSKTDDDAIYVYMAQQK